MKAQLPRRGLLNPHSSKPAPEGLSGVGKLSAKHATKHVARTPIPPGGVNAKGQKKVTDPKTGKIRFIDMKHGMVQSATGVPVRPPSRGDEQS